MLSGCTTAPPQTTLSPSPTAAPVYDVSLAAEAEIAPSTASGEWLVLGIARADAEAIAHPLVLIVLRDASGAEIARRTIELPADPLPSAMAWPFQEPFRPTTTPASVEATLFGNRAVPAPGPILVGRILSTFLDAQGGTVALGSLSNPGPGEASVDRLRLLGRDAAGTMRETLDAQLASARLGPKESVPFLARLPRGSEDFEWEVFPIARRADGSPLTVEILEVHSDRDDQGNPFVSAVVHNNSHEPLWLTLTGVVLEGERWLVGDSFTLPVPLAPGGRAPFALRIPGVGLPQAEAVEWLLVPHTTPAEASPISVPSEVVGYESVGSTLFLRVRITAGAGTTIQSPSAYASMTGDEGQIVSAGWGSGPPMLTPGASVEVTLALPLPRGFDLTLGQLDVQAAGLGANESAP